MKKKRRFLIGAACVLFVMLTSIVAFAGDYDTPTIPICTNHRYVYEITTPATCTADGQRKGTCSKCSKVKTETISARGHLFELGTNQTWQGVEVKCRDCDHTERVLASKLLEDWYNLDEINGEPFRTAIEIKAYTAYLDLDGNNILNAKDYARIVKLDKTEKRLIRIHNNEGTDDDLLNGDEYNFGNGN